MSARTILLVGSLPPTATNAAHLMDQLARSFAQQGVTVHCLIDTLGQAPNEPAPYMVHRRSDLTGKTLEAIAELPRLYVLGTGGDSLFAFDLMHQAPGGVIVADNSLLPLAPAVAELSGKTTEDLARWFESRFGASGWTAAQAAYGYRRRSSKISTEISAYGFALSSELEPLALNARQFASMQRDGLKPTLLNSHLLAPEHPNKALQKQVQTILVIGAKPETKAGVETEQKEGTLGDRLTILWCAATAIVSETDLQSADAIFILGHEDAAACPLLVRCAKSGLPCLTSGQSWAEQSHPSGIPLLKDHPASIIHAAAALATIDGLADAIRSPQAEILSSNRQGGMDGPDLLDHCATISAKAGLPEITNPLAGVQGTAVGVTTVGKHQSSVPTALVGRVPIPPILAAIDHNLPGYTHPKLMDASALQAFATFLALPAPLLPSRMGFEAPVVELDSGDDQNQRGNWLTVSDGLKAEQVIAWGLDASDLHAGNWIIHQGATPKATASWTFMLSEAEVHLKPDQMSPINGFEPDTGFAWTYDPLRKIAKLAFMTGGAGQLTVESLSPVTTLMVHAVGAKAVQALAPETDCEIEVANHGLAMLELTDVPSEATAAGSGHPLLDLLQTKGLHFDWVSHD